jgi:glycosyltransferase involved in cell wall biosynthesis
MDQNVSIIIPVKNGEQNIENCLNAIFKQTIDPLEVIIVDGYSTDRTIEIVKKFPIKIFYENYGTVGGARRVGVENAMGTYVAFTDSDCIPKLDWLENLIKEFNEDIVGVGGSTINVGNGIWKKSIALALDSFLGSANSVQDRTFKHKKQVKSISGCNCSYRRCDLLGVGNFNQNLAFNEDTELNKRLLEIGKILYTPNSIIYHHQDRGLREFFKRIFLFGQGRAINKLIDLQIVPPILALLALISLFVNLKVFEFMMLTYIIILLFFDIVIFFKHRKLIYLFSIPVVFIIEHLAYTLGFWNGILKRNFSGYNKANQGTQLSSEFSKTK